MKIIEGVCACVSACMGVRIDRVVLAGIERVEGMEAGESSYPCGSCTYYHEGKGVSDLLL
jgi:hypothetical protein